MIIEFKSKAAGAFFMTEPVARMVFAAIGHEFSAKGIFTEEEVPVVRAKLSAVIDQSKTRDRNAMNQHDDATKLGESVSKELPIGLSQRAYPLLEMLSAAEKKKVSVVWGV